MFPGNGHIFRTSNERNARTFLAEREMFGPKASQRLPGSPAGRVAFVVLVLLAAVVLVLALA
ncbi:hypothetical protein SAMN06265360_11230 [Haloechinothrix alba]|uniref:Uncharacterized protein n=1 Tax=Haloechinothrix alba TaxID=664784 RepID=A0A238XSB4_9PSEU|nr:hypothetical protein [Haloechinothrix alba]SNR61592.1 hypothetical protein SAMN06265360_11230 [Haloechinothrix alba]